MQRGIATKPAVGIVFDTGLSRIDDALTMSLLFGLDGKKEERVVSLSTSRANLKAAIYTDVVARFYSGAASGAFGFGGRTLPVGMADSGSLKDDLPFFTSPLTRMLVDGKQAYTSDIHSDLDTGEVGAEIRNALTTQWDDNAIFVVSGPMTNLATVLGVGNAKDWIQRKVRSVVFTGGRFPEGAPDANIKADIESARKVFAEWPSPIVACGAEMDGVISYPGSSIEKDFTWSPAHPVVDSYRVAGTMPYDAPVWAMNAALYAVRPQEGYFKLSEPGTIAVLEDGRTKFTPSASGKHRYMIYDPAQKERILKAYTEIVSAKPVPPPARNFRPKAQQQEEEKKDEEKKPDQPVELKEKK